MSIEIKVPVLPESVADATIAAWHKKAGDFVRRDENLVDIETDKVVLEVVAPEDGVLEEILHDVGSTVLAEQLIGRLRGAAAPSASAPAPAAVEAPVVTKVAEPVLTPSVRRAMGEQGVTSEQLAGVAGSGPDGRLVKEDVAKVAAAPDPAAKPAPAMVAAAVVATGERSEKRVPMTRLRKRIAERLLEAKNNTAMLTTFNEVDMAPINELRKKYGETFEKKHGVRLGFMSFYVKAVVEALKRYPEVNAALDGDDIVYHSYFDISIAVSTPRGLVTPVLRDADQLSMAEIETAIKELAVKGRDGKLTVDDLTGGNFTITNGGVFGSLMSTPIINPPQSAILGMHKIQDRPVVVNGQIVIRPMMYVALSYDHRIVDGRESVGFLVTVKELLEDPTRLLLEI
ncbi:MAG: 2-oxoglutarate dehydrogenase complex dihydrolipoyllysine-residue succinyltransferase [Gammaproteobacteria bacterium]|nr:2-oxoglutarate dehydrogenase complex dihydrolipoyllysine-residue succinyltransferase [Gammaproteobacteria bacterium]